MKIEREDFETDNSFEIRKTFIEKFMSGKKKTKENMTTALVYSNILRNIVLLGCSYEDSVEAEINKINEGKK